jgi:hypothetical protein
MATGRSVGSGRLRQSGPGAAHSGTGAQISVRFDASSILRLVSEVDQRFRSANFYAALKRANERAARVVQFGMVDELERKIGPRPQRPGKRLARSIMNERNREVFANTFTVGRATWLDQSPAALYWRRIEEGDKKTFNSRIFFTNNNDLSGPYAAPWSPGGSTKSWGRNGGTSRNTPGGFPHMRMPQHMAKGVMVVGIGPYPDLEYSQGGRRAFSRLNMEDLYRRELGAIGITLSKGMAKRYDLSKLPPSQWNDPA